jgi:hypothetical protein
VTEFQAAIILGLLGGIWGTIVLYGTAVARILAILDSRLPTSLPGSTHVPRVRPDTVDPPDGSGTG